MFSIWLFGLLAIPVWVFLMGMYVLGRKLFPNSGYFEIDSDHVTGACVGLVSGIVPMLSLASFLVGVVLTVFTLAIILSQYIMKKLDL